MSSDYLWALDLRDGWPRRSHPIVAFTDVASHTACGRTYRLGEKGCWSTNEPANPLPKLACSACGDARPLAVEGWLWECVRGHEVALSVTAESGMELPAPCPRCPGMLTRRLRPFATPAPSSPELDPDLEGIESTERPPWRWMRDRWRELDQLMDRLSGIPDEEG